jgi:hypothetical protein
MNQPLMYALTHAGFAEVEARALRRHLSNFRVAYRKKLDENILKPALKRQRCIIELLYAVCGDVHGEEQPDS